MNPGTYVVSFSTAGLWRYFSWPYSESPGFLLLMSILDTGTRSKMSFIHGENTTIETHDYINDDRNIVPAMVPGTHLEVYQLIGQLAAVQLLWVGPEAHPRQRNITMHLDHCGYNPGVGPDVTPPAQSDGHCGDCPTHRSRCPLKPTYIEGGSSYVSNFRSSSQTHKHPV